ncbi:nucleobase:cation symporter-2 family protein [Alicyclobacillus fastidiosus]|uniref:Nucleobase:cation symporter-2 family protein n=1 Tax=Alicyclobacillus fastidiosus TaxID=392011 RepID=A0ABV5AFG1_9BACL|nr:nucleobase:cation symporter-2 family protein [Alicyclobacillus fastidiosus]WEH09687.1 nucleobase:cation symporter-2 family protein [Alicyclobacillus fastidiosus]
MLNKRSVFALGFQHVLAMYAGSMIVPLIIGGSLKLNDTQMAYLIAADMFTCGIATLLQVIGNRFVGIRLPVVLGCTFTAVGPIVAIGHTTNLPTIFDAIVIAGILVFLLAPVFGRLLKFFPPIVTGSVVTIIGLSLIPVAMNDAAGGQGSPDFGQPHNLILALGTLVLIVVLNRFFKGFLRSISVLVGLIAGTIAGYALGMVNFSSVAAASWVNIVHPLYFGKPQFNIAAIITMFIVCVVSMVESTGVYYALSKITEKPIEEKDIVKGLRAEGIAIVLGGLFNTFPYTAFSQNVGLVSMTRVKNRSVVVAAGGILLVLGLLPKVAALVTVIPSAVLGGAMIAMFGMVVAYGMNMLGKVDLRSNENLLIIACSISIGLGSAVVPQMFEHLPNTLNMLLQSGIVPGTITAVLMNLFLNHFGHAQMSEALQDEKVA